jgi:hypothetical protein
MLKGILKDRGFNSSDEIEEGFQGSEMSSLLRTSRASSRTGRAAWCASLRTGESMLTNQKEGECLCFMNVEVGGAGDVLCPLDI